MDPLPERETEIRFLRRERRLLIDQDQARCRVLQKVLTYGGVLHPELVEPDLQEIGRTQAALLALHLEASGGIERPNGSPCQCILCAPRRDLGPREVAWTHLDDPENFGAVLPCDNATCKHPRCPTAADALAEKALGFCRHVMGAETCLIGRVAGSDPTAPHYVTCANCGVKIPWEDWTEEDRAEWLNRLKEEN